MLRLEPMMKPPSKFLFFAIFSQNCVFFWYLFSLHPIPVGGGLNMPPPFFRPFLVNFAIFFTNHFFRQNPTTFVKDIFFQNCKKVFKITFENFNFRAIDQSINQKSQISHFCTSFLTHLLRLFKKTFLTKSSSFLLLKWLVKKNFQKNAFLGVRACWAPPPTGIRWQIPPQD